MRRFCTCLQSKRGKAKQASILNGKDEKGNAEPQETFAEPITKEIPTVAFKNQLDEVEDKISLLKSDTEPPVGHCPPEEKKLISPTAAAVTTDPKVCFVKPSGKVQTDPSKDQLDEVEDKISLLKSDTELPVGHCPPEEEKLISPTAAAFTTVPTDTSKHLTDEIRSKSSLLESSREPLPIYQVPLEEEQINVSGCKHFRFGNNSMSFKNRTIMVMGATGAGKSTLIDGMINYILGIRRNDEYRFKLVKEVQKETQAMSQTSQVTVYKLNHQEGFQIDYSLTIIDTPGYGDTRGIERDMEITEMIRNLFMNKIILDLDAVCFVVQAALARLTPSQKYVFDSVLSIFGKDIAENIRVLVTFADGKRPPVLEAITASGVPCPQQKGAPLHFKFNNSALFSCSKSSANEEVDDDEEEGFDEMFWKMGQKSMERFFVALNVMQTKSLILTTVVLSERKRLENLVENLRKQARVGLCKLEEIKQTSEILLTHVAEINRNAKFEYEVTVNEPRQILKKENTFITNCQQCNYTCHESCAYANDADKIRCCAMGDDGKCTVCPAKCIWSVHFNQKYRWEYIPVKKKETIQELKEKYDVATGEKNAVEVLMKKLEDEYEDVQIEVTGMMDRSSTCLNRLKEIALKPDPLSTPDYIDVLIKGEKSEAKPGWANRVKSLMEMKEKAEYMVKVDKGESPLDKKQKTEPSFMTRMMSLWRKRADVL